MISMVETCDLNSLQAVQDFGEHPLYYICCIFATVVGAIARLIAADCRKNEEKTK